jgi:UDP-glucose 4-epimerase|tara:strand:- start:1757 stop:2758 length:1002 start_codon:yes stop_codon:yes gene_type:complete
MKILITGAAGQIGSGLAKRIYHKHELTLVDNLRNGYLKHLKDDEGNFIAPFHNIDIATDELFSHCGTKFDTYDAIIHLAAITSLPDCETNPIETLHCNVSATANVLDFARKMNVPHVVFASTSAIYENNDVDVFTEDLEVSPRLYYSLSKKMCEDLIESYRKHYGSKVTVLRFFNVFGPDGDQTRPHPPLLNFVYRELSKGKTPVLSGDGEQVRDFICIDDVVSMLDLCLEKQPNDVFNVCTGKVVSVNQIARWVAEALGKEDLGLDYKPAGELWDIYPDLFQGNYGLDKNIVAKETTKYSKGSCQKAKDVLGWEPNLDIESLVKKVTKEIAI